MEEEMKTLSTEAATINTRGAIPTEQTFKDRESFMTNTKQSFMKNTLASRKRPDECVKFRTYEEQVGAQGLKRRDTSCGEDKKKVGAEDFEFIGILGQGSYGKVFLAKKKLGGKFYAIKVIQKKTLMMLKKQHEVFRERQALIMLDHPNIVKMYWSFDVILNFCNYFQDKKSLYFVLDYASNG